MSETGQPAAQAVNITQGYDIIVAVDLSGSMTRLSKRDSTKTRFQEAEELAIALATEAEKVDEDGIELLTFGNGANLRKGVKAADIHALFDSIGATQSRTDTDEMVRVAARRQKESGKNTIVVAFTDGEPSDKQALINAIIDASNGLSRDEELTFGFIQVGDDASATAFLQHLDDELQDKGAKFDIVDAITADAASRMDALEMFTKFVTD